MSHFRSLRWQLVGILALVLALLVIALVSANGVSAGPAGAPPPPAGGAGGNISSKSQGFDITKDNKPWTAERMKAAKPYPVPRVDQAAVEANGAETEAAAAPVKIAGKLPTVAHPAVAPNLDKHPAGIAPQSPTGYSYWGPFNEYAVDSDFFYWNYHYPYDTVGKLYFMQNGVGYVCSAAVIAEYTIWTAGHCVHAGNGLSSGWSYNIVFVPGYWYGAPYFYGVWDGSWSETTSIWFDKGNPGGLRGDFGFVTLFTNAGSSIRSVVGQLGFAYNWPYEEMWNIFGYPAESPFNGEELRTCQASYAYKKAVGSGKYLGYKYPKEQAVGCNHTGGTSGGPWIFLFENGNYLNGNNSFRRTGYNNEMFSPHFDDRAYSLWYDAYYATP